MNEFFLFSCIVECPVLRITPMEPLNINRDEQQNNAGEIVPKKGWLEKLAGRPLKFSDKLMIGVLIIFFLFVFYIVLDANKYPALVHVIEGQGAVGVNPTSKALDFGDLSRGSSAVRRVKIENKTFMPMYIAAFKAGSIADLVKIDNNFYRMGAHAEEKMEFTLYMPASAVVDHDYTGRVFLFKIPTFGL